MAGGSHPAADRATAATWEALRAQTAPGAFTAAVADMVAAHLDRTRPVVDVGAGSGQLLAALAERGVPVIALDLSLAMLERIPARLPRVAADAAHLPLADGAAGAVLAAHVLHVVPDWRTAVAELDRVAGPDGAVLVQAGASSVAAPGGPALRAVFADHLPARARDGNEVAADGAAAGAALVALGRTATELPAMEAPRQETLRGVLRWLAGNPWTWPGPTTDAERASAAAATVAWAAAQGIDLDEPFETASVNRWWSYRR